VQHLRALGTAINRYFILYDLETPEVVGGQQYLARLNAPTPWSQRIMPRLHNFARGGGRVAATAAVGQGRILAMLRLTASTSKILGNNDGSPSHGSGTTILPPTRSGTYTARNANAQDARAALSEPPTPNFTSTTDGDPSAPARD